MPSCSRDEPSAPHSLGDLSIDDAQRRVTLAQFLGAIDRVWADRMALGGNVIWQAVFCNEKAGDSARPSYEFIGFWLPLAGWVPVAAGLW